MKTMQDVEDGIEKEFGEGAITVKSNEVERIPTGFFPFDLSYGGGFPRGAQSLIYGPEGCGKTTMTLKTIANHQRLWPKDVCVYFDIENAFDSDWAETMGVDITKLKVWKPLTAEKAVDWAQDALKTVDCGLMVIDSLAALMTIREVEEKAEKAAPGASALTIRKLVNKINVELGSQHMSKRYPSIIYVNQIRHKIGVMFGDPETMPGGNIPKFASMLTIRLAAANVINKDVSSQLPVAKTLRCTAKKWKVPITATHCEFDYILIPHKDLQTGDVDDWNFVKSFLERYGLFGKIKGGYQLDGVEYKTVKAARASLLEDQAHEDALRQIIVDKYIEEMTGKKVKIGDVSE